MSTPKKQNQASVLQAAKTIRAACADLARQIINESDADKKAVLIERLQGLAKASGFEFDQANLESAAVGIPASEAAANDAEVKADDTADEPKSDTPLLSRWARVKLWFSSKWNSFTGSVKEHPVLWSLALIAVIVIAVAAIFYGTAGAATGVVGTALTTVGVFVRSVGSTIGRGFSATGSFFKNLFGGNGRAPINPETVMA